MIGLAVGSGGLEDGRARHALGELLTMAGFPRSADRAAVSLYYGRGGRRPTGGRVIIPHDPPHVPRDLSPETWRDGGADVPVLFLCPTPEGEVLESTVEGHPLVVRAGSDVYLGCDLARGVDYYINGRGEVGWPRDADDRPSLAGAPGWRRNSLAVAVVSRYARLLTRALAAAAEAAEVPLLRFRPWPGGAPFALALSHDVDRLAAPRRREMLRALLRSARGGARAGYSLWAVIRGAVPFKSLPALMAAEEVAGGVSTFFVGSVRRGPMDYDYNLDAVTPLAQEIAAAGREVALHSSYYSAQNKDALAFERWSLAAQTEAEIVGVRGHYLRLAGNGAWAALEEAGFEYDASFGFPAGAGFRGGAAHPYRPYNGADDRPYNFVLIPMAIMDGTLYQYLRLDREGAYAYAQKVLDEAAAVGGVASLNWHYRAFKGGAFPAWGVSFGRLVRYALAAGARPMTHRAIADRYRLNAVLIATPAGRRGYNVEAPSEDADIVWEPLPGWRLADGEGVRLLGNGTFTLAAGMRRARVNLARIT